MHLSHHSAPLQASCRSDDAPKLADAHSRPRGHSSRERSCGGGSSDLTPSVPTSQAPKDPKKLHLLSP